MRYRFSSLAAGLLFLLYSTNAYACLYSMTSDAASRGSMSMEMPMDDATTPQNGLPNPCSIVACDAAAAQRTDAGCQLSSAAAALGGLIINQSYSPPPLPAVTFGRFVPGDLSAAGPSGELPPPGPSLPLFLLHAALLL